jgi:putative hemolysin
VGDIFDEHDMPQIELQNKGVALIDGSTTIGDFNAEHGAALDDADYTTIGGWVFGALGRLPKAGDRVAAGNRLLEVAEMDGRRVKSVRLVK